MKSIAIIMLLSLFGFNSAIAKETGPKWCKSSKLSSVEKVICSDKALGAADVLMSHLYQEVMAFRTKPGNEGMWSREVYSNQLDWIEARNKIKTRDQILDAYMTRNQELYRGLLGRRELERTFKE